MMKAILSRDLVLDQDFKRMVQPRLKANISVCQSLVCTIRGLFPEKTRQHRVQTWDTLPASAQVSPATEVS